MTLIGTGLVSAHGAAPASVSGVVRDSTGVPQIGAVVQLLRPDLSVVASVYTNGKGRFTFGGVFPGHYAVKAMGASYLPSLRENVRVRANTIVNLTLNSLYEVMQWLPAQPRGPNAGSDDWKWTLRSAANRPLLRWLEDGPLVVVSEGPRSKPRLKARLMAMGHQGTFGEDGQRISVEIENTPSDSRELLASVDFSPSTDAGMESMLGFRQDLGYAGSVQSVAAIAIHPEIEGAGTTGLDEAAMRTWQNMNMGDEFEVEAGAVQAFARLAQDSPNVVMEALPFFSAAWKSGNSSVRYRMATEVPSDETQGDAHTATWMPAVSMREGKLALERGLHQEIGWERRTDDSEVAVMFYSDHLTAPVLEAMAHSSTQSPAVFQDALYDTASGILRVAGPGYNSTGVVAAVERSLPGGHTMRASWASGDALVLVAPGHALTLRELAESARSRTAQTYSLSLSGTLEGTGTHWRASYRWQPEETVTRVAAYSPDFAEPFFTIHLRQPFCRGRDGGKGLDAMLDMRNVLSQGQRRFMLTDGSLLVFAQDQRSISAGLAFTF